MCHQVGVAVLLARERLAALPTRVRTLLVGVGVALVDLEVDLAGEARDQAELAVERLGLQQHEKTGNATRSEKRV